MDILDIFLDILLKPLQPLMGLFFISFEMFDMGQLVLLYICTTLQDSMQHGAVTETGCKVLSLIYPVNSSSSSSSL